MAEFRRPRCRISGSSSGSEAIRHQCQQSCHQPPFRQSENVSGRVSVLWRYPTGFLVQVLPAQKRRFRPTVAGIGKQLFSGMVTSAIGQKRTWRATCESLCCKMFSRPATHLCSPVPSAGHALTKVGEAVVGSALITQNLKHSGLSSFLDNIPYRGVIWKQRQHRLAILVRGPALVTTGAELVGELSKNERITCWANITIYANRSMWRM
jgi:hypothetical protein